MRSDLCPPRPDRIRQRHGGFGWIEHRFVRDGFLEGLHHPEALLYVFLAIVADSRGLSFYSRERICQLLRVPFAHTLDGAIAELAARDLVACQGGVFQVLDLPAAAGLYGKPR